MNFLVDAQLPAKLCEILKLKGFNSNHVDELPDGDETSDQAIALYADEHNLILITKDTDFYHAHMLLGKPQKLLLITTGNIKNRKLFDLIRSELPTVQALFETCSYVELSNEGTIGHE